MGPSEHRDTGRGEKLDKGRRWGRRMAVESVEFLIRATGRSCAGNTGGEIKVGEKN